MLSLPRITAPARLSRSTTDASRSGMRWRKAAVPAVQGSPAMSMLSFTAMGIPSRGPSARRAACRSRLAAAARSAPSRSMVIKHRSSGSSFAIEESRASAVSIGLGSPRANPSERIPTGSAMASIDEPDRLLPSLNLGERGEGTGALQGDPHFDTEAGTQQRFIRAPQVVGGIGARLGADRQLIARAFAPQLAQELAHEVDPLCR